MNYYTITKDIDIETFKSIINSSIDLDKRDTYFIRTIHLSLLFNTLDDYTIAMALLEWCILVKRIDMLHHLLSKLSWKDWFLHHIVKIYIIYFKNTSILGILHECQLLKKVIQYDMAIGTPGTSIDTSQRGILSIVYDSNKAFPPPKKKKRKLEPILVLCMGTRKGFPKNYHSARKYGFTITNNNQLQLMYNQIIFKDDVELAMNMFLEDFPEYSLHDSVERCMLIISLKDMSFDFWWEHVKHISYMMKSAFRCIDKGTMLKAITNSTPQNVYHPDDPFANYRFIIERLRQSGIVDDYVLPPIYHPPKTIESFFRWIGTLFSSYNA